MKNEQWYKFNFNQLKSMLDTDFDTGLSHKEAKKRQKKYGKNVIFPHTVPKTNAVSRIHPGIIAVLLVLISVIYYFVSRDISAFFICFLLIVNYLFVISAYKRSRYLISQTKKYSEPEIRVLREGKIFRINQKAVVPGDIVLLREGDIVPCDGRILCKDDNFKVLEMNISGGDGEKDVDFISYEPSLPTKEQKNTVFAASVVFKGEAKILCCATDKSTVVRRRNLTSSQLREGELELFKLSEKLSNYVSLAMIFAVFLLGAISLFVYGLSDKMTDSFILLLSYAASSMCEFFALFSCINVAYCIFFAPTKEKNFNENVIIKNISAIDKINKMTCVIIPKTSGICSDEIKTQYIYTNGHQYSINKENFSRISRVCSIAHFTVDKTKKTHSADELAILNIAVENPSTELLEYVPAGGVSLFDTALTYSDGELMIILKGGADTVVNRCTSCRKMTGVHPLDKDNIRDLLSTARSYEENGYKIIAVATKKSEYGNLNKIVYSQTDLCFEGFIILRETVVEGCKETIKALTDAGIKVIMFCDDISGRNEYLAENLGISDDKSKNITSYEFVNSNLNLQNIKLKNYRLYQGFDAKQKRYIIDRLKKNGERIGILGSTLSDVSLTVGSSVVSFSVGTMLNADKQLKGATLNSVSSDKFGIEALKLTSDVLVESAGNSKNGGINSVFDAVEISKRVYDNAGRIAGYLFTSLLIRFILSVLSVFTPLISLTPSQMLFSGLAVDLCGILVLSCAKPCRERIYKKTSFDILKEAPIPLILFYTVLTLISAVLTVLVCYGIKLLGMGFFADSGAYFAYILIQIALVVIFDTRDKKFKLNKGLLIFLLVITEFYLLSSLFSDISRFTALGTVNAVSIMIAFIPAILLLTVRFFPSIKESIKKILKKIKDK